MRVARSDAKLTDTSTTPSTRPSTFSIRAAQLAHVMPSMPNESCLDSIGTGSSLGVLDEVVIAANYGM
ncbi:hypothetical protein ACFL54_01185 [Planctomycetota bacterium]